MFRTCARMTRGGGKDDEIAAMLRPQGYVCVTGSDERGRRDDEEEKKRGRERDIMGIKYGDD